jgi:excisionase family DNA binding protein
MLTKKEAAKSLKCSEKTLERAVKRGEIAAQYTKGANGQIVIFDEFELDRYKRMRDAILHAPAIVPDDKESALAPVENRLPTTTDTNDRHARQADFTVVLADALALALDRRAAPVLTIKEAAQAFNVSQSAIKAAVKAESLKTHKIGVRGSSVIKRADLEKWLADF